MLQVKLNWTGTGTVGGGVSLLNFAGSGGSLAEGAAFAAEAFLDSLVPHLTSFATVQIDPVVLQIDSTTGSIEAALTVTSYDPHVGSAAGDPLPLATQGLISWRTGSYVGGREVRGRFFVPCMSEGDSTSGVMTSVAQGNLESAAAALLGATSGDLGVWSRTHLSLVNVTGYSVSTKFAILRSRRD